MGLPIATTKGGICFAFPNVCKTPAPPAPFVPIPYPSVGQLSDATGAATTVLVGGSPVITKSSSIPSTTGDAAGSIGGLISNQPPGGKVEFNVTFSQTVFAEGSNVVRLSDTTKQNNGNAIGQVLGGDPTVLVG